MYLLSILIAAQLPKELLRKGVRVFQTDPKPFGRSRSPAARATASPGHRVDAQDQHADAEEAGCASAGGSQGEGLIYVKGRVWSRPIPGESAGKRINREDRVLAKICCRLPRDGERLPNTRARH